MNTLTVFEAPNLKTIGKEAFSGRSGLSGHLNLSNAESIGESAFLNCTGFTSVSFGDHLKTIGTSAFENCEGLEGGLEIPASVTSVGKKAFLRCYISGPLTLNEGLKTIGGNAFEFNEFTGDLVIPATVTDINGLAFAYSGFDGGTLTLNEGLKTIGGQTFREVNFKGDLVIPDSVTSLGGADYGAFFQTGFDGSLKLSSSLSAIPDRAFYNCKGFKGKLEIPASVTEIGPMAFSACTGFGTLSLPDSVTVIKNDAFSGCSGITGKLTLPAKLTSIGSQAFKNCSGLEGGIAFPESITTLSNSAFYGCAGLGGDVTLPEGLTSFGTGVFTGTEITALRYHGDAIASLADTQLNSPATLETLDLSGSSVTSLTWTTANASLKEVLLPGTLQTVKLTTKTSLETIDLTGCEALTSANLSGNAIDFSGGKPAEWLGSYEGTKNITGQTPILYVTKGAAERSVSLGEEFTDDYSIRTYNGTDLTAPEAWKNYYDSSNNIWVVKNRFGTSSAYPITRSPKTVDTNTPGEQNIIYYTSNAYLSGLNYVCKLTVENGEAAGESVAVLQISGAAVPSGGLSVKQTGTNSLLASPKGVKGDAVWTVYADSNCQQVDDSGLITVKANGLYGKITCDRTAFLGTNATRWVTATVGGVESAPAKVIVTPATTAVTLKAAAKTKAYGAADAANFGQTAMTAYKGDFYWREPGEIPGTYMVYLYELSSLTAYNGGTELDPQSETFATDYVAACKAKFAAENPGYTLSYTWTAATGKYTITAAPLKMSTGITINAKTYNGTANAACTTADPITGIVAKDKSIVNVAVNAKFDSPDVRYNESGSVVAQAGEATFTVSGPTVQYYSIPSGYESGVEKSGVTWTVSGSGEDTVITLRKDNLSAKINPVQLYCNDKPDSRVYDGTAVAELDISKIYGLVAADQENADTITASYADANVGKSKAVTLTASGINMENYTYSITGTITARPLEVTGLTASSKVYDGTVAAVLSGSPSVDTSGILKGDDVTVDFGQSTEFAGSFHDKNVGTQKRVSGNFDSFLSGDDAANYYLKSTARADITPASLIVVPDAGQSKGEGTVNPAYTYTLQGLQGADKAADVVRGALSREEGEENGSYAFTLGTMVSNPNYILSLDPGAAPFVICDNNAALGSVQVSEGKLAPAFNPEHDTYVVRLPYGTEALPGMNAKAASGGASVSVEEAEDLSGSATVTVTAADGTTEKVYTFTYEVVPAVTVNAAVIKDDGTGKGGIILSAEGGFGGYEYSLDGIVWQNNPVFAGLSAGNYTVLCRDAEDNANSCSVAVKVDAISGGETVPGAPSSVSTEEKAVIPYSAESGEITLIAEGPEGASYLYEVVSGDAEITGNRLIVNKAGSVTVRAYTVLDGVLSEDGTDLTVPVEKSEAVSFTAEVTGAEVFGGNSGAIDITAHGGSGSYEYRIGSGEWGTSAGMTKLFAGVYKISVRDAADPANVTVLDVTVGQPNATSFAAISQAQKELSLGDTSRVTESLCLPAVFNYGGQEVAIVWSSDNASVVGDDGTVTRPRGKDVTHVTLTAILQCGDNVRELSFDIGVVNEEVKDCFVDVQNGDWFHDAVYWAAEKGITNGTDATHFSPFDITTRAQMVTFLWRTAGCPEPTITSCAFTDVDMDSYYGKAVLWAVESGVTKGTSKTTFSPNVNVSRGQAVTFLYRFDGSDPVKGNNPFKDVKTRVYYHDAVLWASENGITQGTGGAFFSPDDDCSRAQVVTFLYRMGMDE